MFAVLMCAAALALPAAAQTPPTADAKAAEAKKDEAKAIQYEPPKRGAPKGRVGGGTRGLDPRELTMAVIAPDHTGYSSMASPKLYWFLSRPISAAFEVSVIEDGATDPLYEKSMPAPKIAGVQVLDLAALGVKLKPDKEYRWFVSLVSDSKSRSGDVVASGRVTWVAMPANVNASVEGASAGKRATAFASAGYWYDAYAAVRELREANPADANAKAIELALVDQVGLRDVARFFALP